MLNKPANAKLMPSPQVDDLSIYYPDSDGEPVAESDYQFYPLTDSVRVLGRHFAHRPDVYVAGNMLVYYRMNDNRTRVAPDVFVVFGVDDHRRRSYIVWREGKAPDFVMEIASIGTYDHDIGRKRDLYAELGVGEYWRYDPTGECFNPPLAGELLAEGQYRAIAVAEDSSGILRGHSAMLGLDICVRPDGELRIYDPVAGDWLRNLNEAEDDRLAAEVARQNAEDRVRELETLLRQHGIAPNDS